MKFYFSSILAVSILLIQITELNSYDLRSERNDLHRVLPKSRGKPFPKPQTHITTDNQHFLDERAFSFQYVHGSVVCDLLSTAFNRYYKIIFRPQNLEIVKSQGSTIRKIARELSSNKLNTKNKLPKKHSVSILKRVLVNIQLPCEDYPNLESDESCI